jgi:hypothetical protein
MKKFLLALALAAATVAAFAYISLGRPYKGFSEPVLLEIPRGTNTASMAKLLAERGVVSQAWQFQVARLSRPGSALQAGEYRFAEPATVWTVYDRIRRGDVYLTELRIPEGYNIFEIAGAVAEAGLSTEAEFLRAARDPSLIRDLAPEATTLEGFLFPSTYHVPRRITARELCRTVPQTVAGSGATGAGAFHRDAGLARRKGNGRRRGAPARRRRLRQPLEARDTPRSRPDDDLRGTAQRKLARNHLPFRSGPPASLQHLCRSRPAARPDRQSWPRLPGRCVAPRRYAVHNFSTTLADHNRAVALYRSRRHAD